MASDCLFLKYAKYINCHVSRIFGISDIFFSNYFVKIAVRENWKSFRFFSSDLTERTYAAILFTVPKVKKGAKLAQNEQNAHLQFEFSKLSIQHNLSMAIEGTLLLWKDEKQLVINIVLFWNIFLTILYMILIIIMLTKLYFLQSLFDTINTYILTFVADVVSFSVGVYHSRPSGFPARSSRVEPILINFKVFTMLVDFYLDMD